jgi:hypothetical protein
MAPVPLVKTALIILVCLGILGFVVPAIASSCMSDDSRELCLATGAEINATNISPANESIPSEYLPTREPVRLDLELKQKTLPGPQYMAFGPSIIGIQIDPFILAICIAVIIVGICAVYIIWRKRCERQICDDPIKDSGEENQNH